MGNISVDVFKDVDFNKEVFKNINKVVAINLDLDGWMAEAEADAEVLHDGQFESLVQTDTFAIVDAVNFIESAYSESTAALDFINGEVMDASEVFLIEGTLGEGENLLSGGSFVGTFTEDPFPPTGSGVVEEYNLTFFDNTGEVFTVSECDETCGTGTRIALPDGATTWEFSLDLDLDMDIETTETLEFSFTSISGGNEFDFIEGELITEGNLGEPLQIDDLKFQLPQEGDLIRIRGEVFNDPNENGLKDDGLFNIGVAGVEVNLVSPVPESTVTNEEGFFEFNNIPNTFFDFIPLKFSLDISGIKESLFPARISEGFFPTISVTEDGLQGLSNDLFTSVQSIGDTFLPVVGVRTSNVQPG